jgi:ketosteroid isomerase-like protein
MEKTNGGRRMSVEDNKAVVRRFFNDALDRGDTGFLDELFNDNCEFYRGDFDEPVRGLAGIKAVVEKRAGLYRDFKTEFHSVIGEDDYVASRQTHTGVHRGDFPTPIGTFDVKDRPIEWSSQVLFRFEGDKISEVRVSRDELALFHYLGIELEAKT